MSPDCWNSLPLLPLKCILQRLSMQDVLAATATCRNWRIALTLGLFNGQRDTLTVNAASVDKSVFLASVFRRCARRLHLHLDAPACQVDRFMHTLVPMFAEGSTLEEIVLIGESYLTNEDTSLSTMLRRAITVRLMEAHKGTLHTFALMGCSLQNADDEVSMDGYPTSDELMPLSAHIDERFGLRPLAFTRLQHVHVDYEALAGAALARLGALPALRVLHVRVTRAPRRRLPWAQLRCEVALTVINADRKHRPTRPQIGVTAAADIVAITDHILVRDINLVAVRVLFCKGLHLEMIKHLAVHYADTLRELQWVDAPRPPAEIAPFSIQELFDPLANPFIFVCWRCRRLQKLVIHGYWISHYDLIGMVRLREQTLRELQISATCKEDSMFTKRKFDVVPLLTTDRLRGPHHRFIKKINASLPLPWTPPKNWSSLPDALTPGSDAAARAAYAAQTALEPCPPFVE